MYPSTYFAWRLEETYKKRTSGKFFRGKAHERCVKHDVLHQNRRVKSSLDEFKSATKHCGNMRRSSEGYRKAFQCCQWWTAWPSLQNRHSVERISEGRLFVVGPFVSIQPAVFFCHVFRVNGHHVATVKCNRLNDPKILFLRGKIDIRNCLHEADANDCQYYNLWSTVLLVSFPEVRFS